MEQVVALSRRVKSKHWSTLDSMPYLMRVSYRVIPKTNSVSLIKKSATET